MARTGGQLIERSPGHWQIKVFQGRDRTGKRRYLSKTVVGSRRDADRKLRDLLGEKDKGRLVQPPRRPLREYLEEWLEVGVAPRLSGKTLLFYRSQVSCYIDPHLGDARLDRLSTLEIQRWVKTLVEKRLSARTVRAAYGTLHTALRQAVR